MRFLRICLHGLILTSSNIAAILLAFGIYTIVIQFRSVNQRAFQTPAALLINVILFLMWSWFAVRYLKRYSLQGRSDYFLAYFAALLLNPILFIPLHYLTQGYLTSFANIIVFWIYQIPINILILMTSSWSTSRLITEGEST